MYLGAWRHQLTCLSRMKCLSSKNIQLIRTVQRLTFSVKRTACRHCAGEYSNPIWALGQNFYPVPVQHCRVSLSLTLQLHNILSAYKRTACEKFQEMAACNRDNAYFFSCRHPEKRIQALRDVSSCSNRKGSFSLDAVWCVAARHAMPHGNGQHRNAPYLPVWMNLKEHNS